MPITKSRRRRTIDAARRLEAGASMLQYKLMGPMELDAPRRRCRALPDVKGYLRRG